MNTYPFPYDMPKVADAGDELAIQTRLRARCRMIAPTMKLVAIPNGGNRTEWEKIRASREGLIKGFPDLIAIAPGFIAFLEMKAKTGSLAQEQADALNWLQDCGYPVGCFRSVATAVAFLREAGAPFVAEAA